MSKAEHDFHLVDPSPLPIMTTFSVLIMAIGAVLSLHDYHLGHFIFPLGFIMVVSCMFSWWGDVIKEGRVDHAHTALVQRGLSLGMLLFIVSEIMFFVVFFWGFFKSALSPAHILEGVWATINGTWPPKTIQTLDAWNIPLLNTLILLLSGTTVTWGHVALIENDRANLVKALKITVILGFTFSMLQALEYHHAEFKFTDGIYPSVFYMATGFHGAHVLIGSIFLSVCLYRARKGHFDQGNNHLGFVFAAWYWHFVDAVWLFLFVFVYVWGS